MGKFRKKAVVIEAVQLTGELIDEMFSNHGGIGCTFDGVTYQPYHAEIATLEGTMKADIGDYIITGVKGERYPCKPDIFLATYDPASFEKEMKKLEHDLLTTKYTSVFHEEQFTNNAPHSFEVRTNDGELLADIHFQEGPIKEVGINGVNNEDLIAMVICRLENFNNSPFRSRDNSMAVTKLEEALLWLRKRTVGRENRGVEGTLKI